VELAHRRRRIASIELRCRNVGSRNPRAIVDRIARRAETESKCVQVQSASIKARAHSTTPRTMQLAAAFVMMLIRTPAVELSAWVPIHATGSRG
jgi:hypothetical protein